MATKTKKPTKQQILEAWQEAKPIKGKNPQVWRKDSDGNLIRFKDFDTSGPYAWEIN
ncbi:MAG: hypothetical protein OXU45_09750 [Candidatus Melainabacteria bacterium]|nr:hypothetical protein [Candidatus Melainabacteria bacterium]